MKSISSSGKSMFIDFKKQYEWWDEKSKFTTLIKYKKINSDCGTWLDLTKNMLMSPHHFNNTFCKWLITVNFGSYIILNFKFIEVIFSEVFLFDFE